MNDNISYILYDPDTGELLGGYLQVPPEVHQYWVPATEIQRQMWPIYMLNEDRTGVVLDPRYQPGYVPPQPEPEDPPVDPEPEEPVQSGN